MQRRRFLGFLGGLACLGSDIACAQEKRALGGRVLRPGDVGYDKACRLYNPAVPVSKPQALVFCNSVQQVQDAIRWSRQQGLPCSVRNGRHSEAGYCQGTGLTIDVSPMVDIHIDTAGKTALVQGGARCGDVLQRFADHNLALPMGTCLSVGLAGLALGGGFGMASRQWGLTCDNLLDVQMVTADGESIACSPDAHPDLFWASRGGGGGQFGVVTAMRFRLHSVQEVSWIHIEWPWQKARGGPDRVAAMGPPGGRRADEHLPPVRGRPGESGPIVALQGTWLGATDRLTTVLEPLLSAVPPARHQTGRETYLANARRWGSTAADPAPPSATRSQIMTRPWSPETIQRILQTMERRQQSHSMTAYGGIELNAFGGAITGVGTDDSAFAHRNARALCLFESNWTSTDPASTVQDNLTWLTDLYAASVSESGGAYVNMQDSRLEAWQQAYFGPHWERLQAVKTRYDADNLFRFAQSVTPTPVK